jgi:hypothetical protein
MIIRFVCPNICGQWWRWVFIFGWSVVLVVHKNPFIVAKENIFCDFLAGAVAIFFLVLGRPPTALLCVRGSEASE